jgi:PAS domain-containing protein
VARDITEKVLMETEQELVTKLLHENEERLRLIIENISEAVIVANPQREVVLANDMANIILGIDDNVKVPFDLTERFELLLPDEKTVVPAQNLPMERALAGEETNDLDLIIRNSYQKKRILISGRPLVDNENKVVAGVVTIKDISNYKQLEEELKEYRQLIGFKAGQKA